MREFYNRLKSRVKECIARKCVATLTKLGYLVEDRNTNIDMALFYKFKDKHDHVIRDNNPKSEYKAGYNMGVLYILDAFEREFFTEETIYDFK